MRRHAAFFGPFGDAHVEAGIIYEDDGIGGEREDVFLAKFDVSQDGTQVHDNLGKSHECEVAVVPDQLAARCCHEIAAPESDLGRGVFHKERFDEAGTVEVARCFAGDDIILHQIRVYMKDNSVETTSPCESLSRPLLMAIVKTAQFASTPIRMAFPICSRATRLRSPALKSPSPNTSAKIATVSAGSKNPMARPLKNCFLSIEFPSI